MVMPADDVYELSCNKFPVWVYSPSNFEAAESKIGEKERYIWSTHFEATLIILLPLLVTVQFIFTVKPENALMGVIIEVTCRSGDGDKSTCNKSDMIRLLLLLLSFNENTGPSVPS